MLGRSQVWAIGLGQEGVVSMEGEGRLSGCFIFPSQVLVNARCVCGGVFLLCASMHNSVFLSE